MSLSDSYPRPASRLASPASPAAPPLDGRRARRASANVGPHRPRDVQALLEAGVPVKAERGPGGGFTLPSDYRTRLPLTVEETQALLIGAPGAAGALGLGGLLLEARLKVLAALPTELRRDAARAEALFHVDEPRWFSRAEESPFLAELAAAASEERRISVEYGRRDEVIARTLDPLGLVLKAGVWYLAARGDGELRVVRISRLVAVAAAP